MHRDLIFGNSGSGKSTLATERAKRLACPHLDLDTLAWKDGCTTPTRKPLAQSAKLIEPFLANNESWVIEGCYADLLELVIPHSTEIVFLNPDMLLAWVEQYPERSDEFSLQAHRRLFDQYAGKKREYSSNDRSGPGP